MIVHAGDICSSADVRTLQTIAPLKLCLGNNDYDGAYGPSIKRTTRFNIDGLRWQICHYQRRLDLANCDIAICGHTHRPLLNFTKKNGPLLMNPGSPTYPRQGGPTMGRIICEDGIILSAEILELS